MILPIGTFSNQKSSSPNLLCVGIGVFVIKKRGEWEFLIDYNNRQLGMKAKPVQRKFKRYLTEPDELAAENRKKINNLTLKQLKLQVAAMDPLPAYVPAIKQHPKQISNHHSNIHRLPLSNHRSPLDKLPELLNTPHFNNGSQRTVPHPAIFRTSNPLFVVNTLFQMLKEDTETGASKERLEKQEYRGNRNEFEEITAKSVKIHRPPRLLDHQFTRLTHQSAFSRRRIYSEEKARPRQGQQQRQEVELLTFYPSKQRSTQESNEFL